MEGTEKMSLPVSGRIYDVVETSSPTVSDERKTAHDESHADLRERHVFWIASGGNHQLSKLTRRAGFDRLKQGLAASASTKSPNLSQTKDETD